MNSNQFNGPLFVIGSPRSGTSLLRLILTNHSHILIPPECGFIIWLYKKYANWQFPDSHNVIRLELFINDLFECKKFDTWLLSREIVENQIRTNQPATYAELCRVVYASFGLSKKKNYLYGEIKTIFI